MKACPLLIENHLHSISLPCPKPQLIFHQWIHQHPGMIPVIDDVLHPFIIAFHIKTQSRQPEFVGISQGKLMGHLGLTLGPAGSQTSREVKGLMELVIRYWNWLVRL